MDVHDNHGGAPSQVGYQGVGTAKRIVDRRHERSAHQVEHGHRHAIDREGCGSLTRHRRRIVRRADNAAAGLEILAEISLVEDVIAAGDKVDSASKDLLGGLRGQAKTARGIFAVGNAGVDAVLLSKQRNASLQHLATGGTYDVPDDQEVEGAIYRRAEAFAFFWDLRK